MIYSRGTIGSQRFWADMVCDEAWTFENLLPYFAKGIQYSPPNATLRAANASVSTPANPDAFASSGGPRQVSYPNFAQIFASYVDGAMRESNISVQQDFNSGSLLGRQYAPLTISYPEEERSSSETSYLRTALSSGRTNMKVYVHTLAKKVLFDGNNTASGVQVETGSYGNSNSYTLSARKEVIISAGAFQSPQLLMESGIGPREQLETHGINVLVDRPGVGEDMQDHLDFGPVWEINIENGVAAGADPALEGPIAEEYRVNRTGQLTNAGVDYIGWEKLPEPYRSSLSASAIEALAKFPPDWPDIEYEITAAALTGGDPSKRFGTMLTIPVSPLSRGWVNITSSDTRVLPDVNPNQFFDPTDRELAVQVSLLPSTISRFC